MGGQVGPCRRLRGPHEGYGRCLGREGAAVVDHGVGAETWTVVIERKHTPLGQRRGRIAGKANAID
eukprot:1539181-Pyramimonas_sp.AAC.1